MPLVKTWEVLLTFFHNFGTTESPYFWFHRVGSPGLHVELLWYGNTGVNMMVVMQQGKKWLPCAVVLCRVVMVTWISSGHGFVSWMFVCAFTLNKHRIHIRSSI